MIYLVQYDRLAGTLIQMREYAPQDSEAAKDARLHLELSLLEQKISHEVVLLDASSERELRKTHGRYFETLEQMVAGAQPVAL
jgi:hypothetical protein